MSNYRAITKTANDIGVDVKRAFGDEAGVQITDSDIIRWVNQGQREILINNQINQAYSVTDVNPGQTDYPLTDLKILQIRSIHINGRPLEYRSFAEAERYVMQVDPTKLASGSPVMWYQYGGMVKLYPAPDTYTAGGLQVYYVKDFTEVVAISDLLSIPDEYFNRLSEYVLAKAYELDDDSQSSQFKLEQFASGLASMQERESGQGMDVYPSITVLPDDSGYFD